MRPPPRYAPLPMPRREGVNPARCCCLLDAVWGKDCRPGRSPYRLTVSIGFLFVAEHGRGEREQLAVGPPPRLRREARLPAGLVEEPLAVPAALGRDLRQQQAAATVTSDDQAMHSDFDRVR